MQSFLSLNDLDFFLVDGMFFSEIFRPDSVLNRTSLTVFPTPFFSHINQSINQSITVSKIATLGRACPLDCSQVGLRQIEAVVFLTIHFAIDRLDTVAIRTNHMSFTTYTSLCLVAYWRVPVDSFRYLFEVHFT